MNEKKHIHLRVTSPLGVLFDASCDHVTVETCEGQITVLPSHIPLLTTLVPGELLIKSGKEEIPLVIYGGFCEVQPRSHVSILADGAEHIGGLDEQTVKEAIEAAERLKKEKFRTEEFEDAALSLERELARMRVLKKYRIKGFRSGKQED